MPAWPRFLSDGAERLECCDVGTMVSTLAEQLAEQEFSSDVAVALPLRNTVGSALRLLALLRARQSVLLMPEPGAEAPRLCERILSVDGPPDRLAWRTNPAFERGAPVGPGRVYLLSSGTSGAAKLVAHDHLRLMRQAEACIDRFGLSAADAVILPVPICHLFGLGAAFLPACRPAPPSSWSPTRTCRGSCPRRRRPSRPWRSWCRASPRPCSGAGAAGAAIG